MKLSGGQNFRHVRYNQSIPEVGLPFVAEVEEHLHSPCGRHYHREVQVLVILSGSMRIDSDDHWITVPAGAACAIPPRLNHWVGAGDANAVETVYIDFRMDETVGPLHGFIDHGDRLRVHTGDPKNAIAIARDLADALRATGQTRTAGVMAALWSLAGCVSQGESAVVAHDPALDRRLIAAERFMRERLATEISVDDLATITGLSRSQLTRLYAKSFSKSPAARLRQLRIEQADHLLKHSSLSVKEVAHVCGFACPNHFSRVYHEELGMTPTDRRKT